MLTAAQIIAAFYPPQAPEYLAVILELAERRTSPTAYTRGEPDGPKDRRPEAVANLAMHMMAMHKRTGGVEGSGQGIGGVVTSRSEGGMSESYDLLLGEADALAGDLGTTSYGRALLAMRAEMIMPILGANLPRWR